MRRILDLFRGIAIGVAIWFFMITLAVLGFVWPLVCGFDAFMGWWPAKPPPGHSSFGIFPRLMKEYKAWSEKDDSETKT